MENFTKEEERDLIIQAVNRVVAFYNRNNCGLQMEDFYKNKYYYNSITGKFVKSDPIKGEIRRAYDLESHENLPFAEFSKILNMTGTRISIIYVSVPNNQKWEPLYKEIKEILLDCSCAVTGINSTLFMLPTDLLLSCDNDCEFDPIAELSGCIMEKHGKSITSKQDKVIGKISKLLALADQDRNNSVEEATSAALHAQRLMAQYNLSENDLEAKADETQSPITAIFTNTGFGQNWTKELARIVAQNLYCFDYYHAHQLDNKRIVCFFGRKVNCIAARRLYEYLYETGNRLGRAAESEYRQKGLSYAGIYNSFCTGFNAGIQKVLEQQCKALMVQIPEDVKYAWMEMQKNSNMQLAPKNTVRVYQDIYKKGWTAAEYAMQSRTITTIGIEAPQ